MANLSSWCFCFLLLLLLFAFAVIATIMRLLFMLLPPRVVAVDSSFAFAFASSRVANSVAFVPPSVAALVDLSSWCF